MIVEKEYTTKNGLVMIEGAEYNWQKSFIYGDTHEDPYNKGNYPYVYSITIGKWSNLWVANWYHEDDKLYITAHHNDTSVKFHANNIYTAEAIIKSFSKGNNLEIMPIHIVNH